MHVTRIDRLGRLQQFEILTELALPAPNRGPEVPDVAVVRQSRRGHAKFLERLLVICLRPIMIKTQGEMAFAEVRTELERFFGRFLHERFAFVGRVKPAINPCLRRGKSGMSKSERRIMLDGIGIELFGHLVGFEEPVRI